MMKLRMKNLLFGLGLAGCAALFSACVGGYAGGGAVVVDTDYYGPAYGGPVVYGHPYYRNDSHVVSPPRRDLERGGRPSAPAHENHPAPAQDDHKRK
ncbi:MAG TPA: hypothetical protein VK717_00835 [Opitutaceae bacterium]|jgi:hypothetical protein|nr:hypothetical protein [Opitutaceae bacterium]